MNISTRLKLSWIDKSIFDQRRIVRNREKIWKRQRQDHQWKAFTQERNRLNRMIIYNKSNEICGEIQSNKANVKKLYKIVNRLTGGKEANPMPNGDSDESLAENFATYFLEKINNIRDRFTEVPMYNPPINESIPRLTSFSPMTKKQVRDIVFSMESKSCELDTIPTEIFKMVYDQIEDLVTSIVNKSLTSGEFLEDWKTAIVRPLLKKLNLALILKNYRPVSNLSFLSKIVERCMLSQFIDHCECYELIPDFQSAYRQNYSTETSLIKMTNDILIAMDKQQVMMTAILDLSAAFDTVDHDVFLSIMKNCFAIEGTAIRWLQSYLAPRGFKVCINNKYSTTKDLTFSVPQGSCAGAQLFTAYCAPIGLQVSENTTLNGFADDHSLRKAYNASIPDGELSTYNQLSVDLHSIKHWMSEMRLKLNDEKTEFIQFGSRIQLLKTSIEELKLGESSVNRSQNVKYLGGILDEKLTFKQHITSKCQLAMFNYFKVKSIRKFLTKEVTELLVIQMCISHLDYSNGMLYGLPQSSINMMQKVQNQCAKLILRRDKYSSSTEALKELHWLPIHQRIKYKLAVLTFKCRIGKAPKYLSDMLENYTLSRTTRSQSDVTLLRTPKTKTKTFGPRAFSVSAPTVWNLLPKTLREATALIFLKKT